MPHGHVMICCSGVSPVPLQYPQDVILLFVTLNRWPVPLHRLQGLTMRCCPTGGRVLLMFLMLVYPASGRACFVLRRKDHEGRGKGRRVLVPPEFEPSANEGNLPFRGVVVPPCGIRPRWDEADHQCAPLAFLVCFPHPQADCPAIGRVHPAAARPRLRQPVIFAGVIARTLGVLRRGAHVEFQRAMQGVHLVEEVLRSRPVIGRAGEVDGNCRTRRCTQCLPRHAFGQFDSLLSGSHG